LPRISRFFKLLRTILWSGSCLESDAAFNLGPKLGRSKLFLHFGLAVAHVVEPSTITQKILVSYYSDQLVMLFSFGVQIALGGHCCFLREFKFVVGVNDLDFN
jgi:hypothetical protein